MKFSVHLFGVVESCRTPSGVRGLKSDINRIVQNIIESHPVRGAWIEITSERKKSFEVGRRTPSGVRGLKFVRIHIAEPTCAVAPRQGCVD